MDITNKDEYSFGYDFMTDDPKSNPDEPIQKTDKRRRSECLERETKTQYRRAFSETQLLDITPKEFKKGYSYSSDTKIEMGKIENKTGEEFDIEIDRMLRAALKIELKKRGLLWAGRAKPKLISNCNILDYAKGNAQLRAIPWLASTRLRI